MVGGEDDLSFESSAEVERYIHSTACLARHLIRHRDGSTWSASTLVRLASEHCSYRCY
jgi:hypothetical protein